MKIPWQATRQGRLPVVIGKKRSRWTIRRTSYADGVSGGDYIGCAETNGANPPRGGDAKLGVSHPRETARLPLRAPIYARHGGLHIHDVFTSVNPPRDAGGHGRCTRACALGSQCVRVVQLPRCPPVVLAMA